MLECCEYDGKLLTEVKGEERQIKYEDKEANFVYFSGHNGRQL